jgi:hypothetical protein
MGHNESSSKGKTHLSASKRKKKKKKKKSLTGHLKALEQKEANSPKKGRDQEIIKLRAETNQVKTKRTIQRINKTRSWFFERNQQDRGLSLAKLTRRHRNNVLISENQK